jgi:hypothetical protein
MDSRAPEMLGKGFSCSHTSTPKVDPPAVQEKGDSATTDYHNRFYGIWLDGTTL